MLMRAIAEIRFLELGRKLTELTGKREDIRNLNILKRLRLNQGGYKDQGDEKKFAEERNLAIALAVTPDSTGGNNGEVIALGVVNSLNHILGLPLVYLSKPSAEERLAENAFFYEKQRNFAKAHALYELLTARNLRADQLDYVLTHKSFCAAMMGKYATGIADLEKLMQTSKNQANIALASEMLLIIRGQADKTRQIDTHASLNAKAEYYHRIGAFAEAARVIAEIPEAGRDSRVLFLYGRALEETGQAREAAINYRTAIQKDASSANAIQANRRLYALGAFYGQGKALREEAKENSKNITLDTQFFKSAQASESLISSLDKDMAMETEKSLAFEKDQGIEQAKPGPTVETPAAKNEPMKPTLPARPPAQQIMNRKPQTIVQADVPVKAPVEDLTNLRDMATAQRAEKLTRLEKKALLAKRYRQIDRLLTDDGNEFFGIIFAENKNKISIFTIMGNLEINKEDITERNKAPIKSIMQ